jgi:hypothetical protein
MLLPLQLSIELGLLVQLVLLELLLLLLLVEQEGPKPVLPECLWGHLKTCPCSAGTAPSCCLAAAPSALLEHQQGCSPACHL